MDIPYKIVYASGEDPNHVVSELHDQSKDSRGWQTERFCDYPQEIVLRFDRSVPISKVQVRPSPPPSSCALTVAVAGAVPSVQDLHTDRAVQWGAS